MSTSFTNLIKHSNQKFVCKHYKGELESDVKLVFGLEELYLQNMSQELAIPAKVLRMPYHDY